MRALDRSPDRRYVDRDGRLHVASTPISKACVNAYRGLEIPGCRELKLDPDHVYRLLRHPDELAKAARSCNSLPIMARHVPLVADGHDPGLVVGATGTNARFVDPYLLVGVAIWSGSAIDDIERRVKKDLSLGYGYRCDPVGGTFAGQPYDLTIREIRPHHVALSRRSRVPGMGLDSSWFVTRARPIAADPHS